MDRNPFGDLFNGCSVNIYTLIGDVLSNSVTSPVQEESLKKIYDGIRPLLMGQFIDEIILKNNHLIEPFKSLVYSYGTKFEEDTAMNTNGEAMSNIKAILEKIACFEKHNDG